MKITLSSVLVDDRARALAFYTGVLGFVKRTDVPAGRFRWLTVVSPEGPDDVELLIEPNDTPAARAYQKSIYEQGAPATDFAVNDLLGEYERMKNLGVRFTQEPTTVGPLIRAVLDDTVGNLIQTYQVAEPARPSEAGTAGSRVAAEPAIEPGSGPKRQPAPNPALRRLDVLFGTWTLRGREDGGGEIRGTLAFELMEGGYFLVQHVDIDHAGQRVKGIEVIGYGRDWEGGAPPDCTSHFFDTMGNHFEYVYEVGDETITI
ncbi:MAG: VOC family protein [Methanospirillum sp.]